MTMLNKTVQLFLCLAFVSQCRAEGDVGDSCSIRGQEGVCVNIYHCSKFIKGRLNSKNFKICSSNGTDVIVICCLKNNSEGKTTPEESERVQEYCEPSSPRRPDMTYGRIAYDKCIDYQGEVVLPCRLSSKRLEDGRTRMHRVDGCDDPPPPLIVGGEGVDAKRGEFAHMALLGYGAELSTAEWLCGGSVISEWFILTAGHCLSHVTLGPVEHIRLGILKRSDPNSTYQFFKVKRVYKHPLYFSPSKYNDIALLETDRKITFTNKFISPACLNVELGATADADYASATGWGALGPHREAADVLQKMDLVKFSDEECASHYGKHRLLQQGFNATTQLCYGHRDIPRDTCQGDSGGPLQKAGPLYCMISVVGVTSFGRACGVTGQPGVYTRVAPYVPWIEGIVWPERLVFATK